MDRLIDLNVRTGQTRESYRQFVTTWQEVFEETDNLRIISVRVSGNYIFVYARYPETNNGD